MGVALVRPVEQLRDRVVLGPFDAVLATVLLDEYVIRYFQVVQISCVDRT